MTTVLTVENMLAADDLKVKDVDVWGGIVRLRSLTAEEMYAFVESNKTQPAQEAGLRILMLSLVDENGARIGSVELIAKFKLKDSATISRLIGEALKLNDLDVIGEALQQLIGATKG